MRFRSCSSPAMCLTSSKKEETSAQTHLYSIWFIFDFKKLRKDAKTNAKQRFSDICVMVIGINDKGRTLRSLLDTGCSKSIVLKKFTDKRQRSKLCDKVQYTTYEGKFSSLRERCINYAYSQHTNHPQSEYQ